MEGSVLAGKTGLRTPAWSRTRATHRISRPRSSNHRISRSVWRHSLLNRCRIARWISVFRFPSD